MRTKLLLLLLSGLLSVPATAAGFNSESACHRLMTEAECRDHTLRLASLPPGEALDRYLAEYTEIRREREVACTCKEAVVGQRESTRQRQQAMLRF
ncbi:MAG: hypothetical protein Q8M09_04090 [Pseudomonadota bacterium]|nr:hypothetical protein [Pseudomonadota bacterium]MDP1903419.1 hypothetical protein [Pseudomonadota bacterium]MDP2352389.1 hypothetical protein [Pseudomonadota bacterium]